MQELEESSLWLELLAELGLPATAQLDALLDESNQLIRIFATSVKTLRRHAC
ncbi:MAG: hypothetical protein H6638_09720 [Ardenticatenales bacterium]|nr:hypothetical protein [Ardenticatenales bacterium]MCB9171875.1 hypothetical protein [Ardenticatenales bacterium]